MKALTKLVGDADVTVAGHDAHRRRSRDRGDFRVTARQGCRLCVCRGAAPRWFQNKGVHESLLSPFFCFCVTLFFAIALEIFDGKGGSAKG
jgi:hypothetical protein